MEASVRHHRQTALAVDDKIFGRRLQDIRKRQGMTQAELAGKLGIHPSLISQYERGYLRLHGALIVRLASVLKTSANEILGTQEPPQNGIDRRFLRRLQAIDRLSKREKLFLLGTVDAFLRGAGMTPPRKHKAPSRARG